MARTYLTICAIVIAGCLLAVAPKQKPATASPAPVDQSAELDAARAANAAKTARIDELTARLAEVETLLANAPPQVVTPAVVSDSLPDTAAPHSRVEQTSISTFAFHSPAAFVAVAPAANCPGGVCYAPPRSQASGGRYRQPANGPLRYSVRSFRPLRRVFGR